MALLNGISSISKGSSATVTLDKTVLMSLSSVAADAYFSIEANIRFVKVVYSALGQQKKELLFDMSQTEPQDTVTFSAYARDQFAVSHVYLYDFDGGHLEIPSAEVPSGLDIVLV